MVETLLYYQRLFEYNGDPLNLLQLPYNLFQDLILKQLELKKKELEREKQEREKNKNAKRNIKPLRADFM